MNDVGDVASTEQQYDDIPPLRRDRRVQAWVASTTLSGLGDAAWMVGLAWTAAVEFGPATAGLVLGIGATPRAVMLLLGGALADRLDPRRTMIATNLARIAILLVGIALAETWGIGFGLLLGIAICFGIADALYLPASSTLPPQLVRPDDLGPTQAMFQLGHRLATLIGAPVGGIAVAWGGLPLVMAIDAASFLVIAVVLATVLKPRFPLARSTGSGVRADLVAGFGYLRRTPPVRTLVLALSGLNLFVSPVIAVGLALRTRSAGWGAGSLGLFEACIGAGAAIGALVALTWRPRRPARTGLVLRAGQATACGVVGVAPYVGIVAAMTTIGVTAGLASAFLSGAFIRTVDGAYLGRMSSIMALGDNVFMPLAMTGFGALAATGSLSLACVVTGLAFATVVLWSASRPIDDPQPVASPA
ncbi:MFS transporter [soil metagenome]